MADVAAEIAAEADLPAEPPATFHDAANEREESLRRRGQLGEGGIAATGGGDVLDQIVAADGVEVGIELLDGERRCWNLDHHANRRKRCGYARAHKVPHRLLHE